MKVTPTSRKFAYILLLTLLSTGAFAVFSGLEANLLIKGYGLLISLQAAFVVIYLGFRRRKN